MKFNSWLLTGFDRVVWFDSDVWWLKSPIAFLEHILPLGGIAGTHLETKEYPFLKGSWLCADYMNSGVLVIEPSRQGFELIKETWERGNYSNCGGSEAGMGDQSVLTDLIFNKKPNVLGTFTKLDLCWNYRGWPSQAKCDRSEIPLLHGSGLWPANWQTHVDRAHAGTCSQR